MPVLQILGAPQSNFVWVTRIVAAEKNVPYELVSAIPHTPAIDAAHPLGKIPAMRHGEVLLGESRAIAYYIDRAFTGPSLVPTDLAAAARTEQWVSIVCTHVDLLLVRQYAGAYFFPTNADGSPDRGRIDPILDQVKAQLELLEGAVSTTGHLVGQSFTLADAYLIPILYYLSALPESSRMMQGTPKLTAYLAKHLERPSVKATLPPPMSELRAAS
jgi:glutathione S-transferase